MSRERELLREFYGIFEDVNGRSLQVDVGRFYAVMADTETILSQPEAEPVMWWRYEGEHEDRFTKGWLQKEKPEENGIPLYTRNVEPEAEPSKTVYGVLATAYRPDQQADQFTVDYPTQGILREVNQHEAGMDEDEAYRSHYAEHDFNRALLDKARRQRDELRAENEALRSKLNKGA